MAERETNTVPPMHVTNTAYFSYATMTTPGHTDIELLTEVLCRFIPTDRIAVHPQTVVVTGLTTKERAQIAMADEPMAGGANILSTDLPAGF